ncbi:MAG: hypothetical protein IH951_11610 [Bacteroidetes bacterium]|nr:hypothetical protein [Bacteroidota bacterium]
MSEKPKYMIMVPYQDKGGDEVATFPRTWSEYFGEQGATVLFASAPAAYKYAREKAIESCMVVKRHGILTPQTKVVWQQELF